MLQALARSAQRFLGLGQRVCGLLLGLLAGWRVAKFALRRVGVGRHAIGGALRVGVLVRLSRARFLDGAHRGLHVLLRFLRVALLRLRCGGAQLLLRLLHRVRGTGVAVLALRLRARVTRVESLLQCLACLGELLCCRRVLVAFVLFLLLRCGLRLRGRGLELLLLFLRRGLLRILQRVAQGLPLRVRLACALPVGSHWGALQLSLELVCGLLHRALVAALRCLLQSLRGLLKVFLSLLVAHVGRELARAFEQVAEVELLLLALLRRVAAFARGALLQRSLVLQQLFDALECVLEHRPPRAGGARIALRFVGLVARELLQLRLERLLVGVGLALACALRLLLKALLALLRLANAIREFAELLDLLLHVLRGAALQEDVEQALDVGDHFLLLAQRVAECIGREVVADRRDVFEEPRALQVLKSLLQQRDLLLLALAHIALLQAVHQVTQSACLAQDLVLVAAKAFHLLLRILGVLLRSCMRCAREREEHGGMAEKGCLHLLPCVCWVRLWTSRCFSISERASCTRSW